MAINDPVPTSPPPTNPKLDSEEAEVKFKLKKIVSVLESLFQGIFVFY